MKRFLLVFFLFTLVFPLSAAPRFIDFAGYSWSIKSSRGLSAPGPNYFSAEDSSVWVDEEGLHLTLQEQDGRWQATEVINRSRLGYGTYVFYLEGDLDALPPEAVLGIFTWDMAEEESHREIDIEFSRWGLSWNHPGQYVVQPYEDPDRIHRFPLNLDGLYTTHVFEWLPDRVRFASYHGHDWGEDASGQLLESWDYVGEVPTPSRERLRLNLWLYRGEAPRTQEEVEVVFRNVEFIPYEVD